jgi:hypothetical protein
MESDALACTLTEDEQRAAGAEYVEAAARYRGAVRLENGEATIALRGEKARIRAFLDALVARETRCCTFLRFDVAEAEDGYRVRLSGQGLETSDLRYFVEAFFPGAAIEA